MCLQPRAIERVEGYVSEMFMACLMGAAGYLYHENGGECRLYSKAEIVAIYGTLSMYKTGQLTYHNQIK